MLRRKNKTSKGVFALVGLVLLNGCSPSTTEETATTVAPESSSIVESVAASPQPTLTPTEKLLVPAEFEVPILVEADGFQLVPLGPELVKIDFDAYMSSIEHLQQTFTRSSSWPRADITDAEAMLDMETEQSRFQNRESFAYAVLTPDGLRERGCVYVRPSSKQGFDAEVLMWVTKAEFDAGFDAELYRWVTQWVEDVWPLQNVAYPGRAIEWQAWDAMATVAVPDVESDVSQAQNLQTAEGFIDAFYSFDPAQLTPFLAHADDSAPRILYYQGWAEGGNYKVLERAACQPDTPEVLSCAITVQDDPVLALKTGFNVTDTFALTFEDGHIVSIDTSSNDQPIYYEARKWVVENMPEVMTGPCKDRNNGGKTPGDCARAMTAGYAKYYATVVAPGSAEL